MEQSSGQTSSEQPGEESVSRGLSSTASLPLSLPPSLPLSLPPLLKLVLHIDVNNTVLVSDAVTSQGTVAALEGYLPGVTWGHTHKGRWQWLSECPSLLPPCGRAVSYYSRYGRCSGFTSSSPGKRFRSVLEEHLQLLLWPPGAPVDPLLSVKGEDGRVYHKLLPSFFQLLLDLWTSGSDFAVVFRTFGTDLSPVLKAVEQGLTHGHPLFSNLTQLKLQVDLRPGQIRCSPGGVELTQAQNRVSSVGRADGERGLYRFFSNITGVTGFRDHYDWWAGHAFSLLGGKPLWIDPLDSNVQHIFIDDNIRANDRDTIVHPRVFSEPGGSAPRSASASELLDLCLVQTDLLKAISDPRYFSLAVQSCVDNYHRNQEAGGGHS